MKTFLTIIFSIVLTISSNAQSNFGVGLSGGVNFPTGDFDEFYNAGYGGDLHFSYHLGNEAIFTLAVGYNRWNLAVDAFNKLAAASGLNWKFELDSHFAIIPVLLGVRWYLFQKKNQPYITFEGGIYNYQFKLEGKAVNTVSGANIPEIPIPEVRKSGTETMLNLGLGYLYTLSKHWLLDVTVKYNIITNAFTIENLVDPESEDTIYGVKGTNQYLSLLAGINYRF